MNTQKAGLTLGVFAGTMHLFWSLMVAFGLAQGYLNFVLKMHFLNNPFTVQAFNISNAILLIVLTSVIGFVVGTILATIYNKFYH
ncbi:hypothetical protein H0W91_00760 [Patescibacteria group bacterium]|nr:hypothetical protein [Patescibacteria group bacterium]